MKSGTINSKTRISELIKANPLVIDTLAEFNPHFSKLKNPILRNLLARRVRIGDACIIGGCKLSEFLDKMASIGFEVEGSTEQSPPLEAGSIEVSNLTEGLKVVELDVRPILAKGADPLKLIMKTSKALKTDECLKVINTFEPIPLISLLCKQGYRSWTEWPGENTFYTWFVKSKDIIAIPDTSTSNTGPLNTTQEFESMIEFFGPDKIHTIDVRELQMPLPMINILEYLPKLKPDEALFVYHKKVPVYLLPKLEEQGFRYFIQKSKGNINMLICKL